LSTCELVAAVIPLFQTGLWVALIAWALRTHNGTITRVIDELLNRVEGGASFKVGSFEVGQKYEASSLERQRADAQEELADFIEDQEEAGSESKFTREHIENEGVIAEDLALRALQAEFGMFIHRHAQISKSLHVDGIIEDDKKYTLVEVKLVSDHSLSRTVKRVADRMQAAFDAEGWKNTSAIICLVNIDREPNEADEASVREELSEYTFRVDWRLYGLTSLRSEFGVGDHDMQ